MFDAIKNIFSRNGSKTTTNALILIVDDGEIDRRVAESALTKFGFRTITAVNGVEGLAMAKSHQPDLILLDCEMPVLNGPDMCKALKNDDTTKDIPVLFLTSVDTPKNVVNCFEIEAESFLSKPVSPKVLTSQIDLILKDFLRK